MIDLTSLGSGLGSIFSGLGSAFSTPAVPKTSPTTGFGALPGLAPKAPAAPVLGNGAGTPGFGALGSLSPNMSTPSGPVRAPAPTIPGTTPHNLAAASQSPALSGHPAVPATGGGTVNANTGAYTPPVPTVNASARFTNPNPDIGAAASYGAPAGTPSIPAYDGSQGSAITRPVLPGGGSTSDTNVRSNPLTDSPELQAALLAIRNANQLSPAEQTAQEQLNTINTAFAKGNADVQGQPIAMPFITGQQAQLQREQAAATVGPAAALALAQQNRTLAQQGATAQLGAATGQLSTLAGMFKPVAGASFFGNPATGGLVGSGTQNMDDAVALQAKKLQNNTTDPASAIAALSAYGQVGVNALQKALGPGFDLNASAGSAAARASNASTAGTAPVTAPAAVYQKAYGDYQDLLQNVANVDQFGTTLTSGMTGADGTVINPTDTKYANMTLANFRSQLSNPSQAQFDSTMAALRSKISGMLAIGGSETPTALSTDAAKVLDGSAPIGTMQATLQRIAQEGNILLGTQSKKVNDSLSALTAAGKGGSNLGTSGAAPSGWGW